MFFICLVKKLLIGRTDFVSFPELGIRRIKVKVDTGAYTSTLHCKKAVRTNKGRLKVVFEKDFKGLKDNTLYFEEFTTKRVRSSNGKSQLRYLIKTKINLFNQEFDIYLTLSSREKMRTPVLLGRKFLKGKFIVDPAKKNLSKKSSKE